MASERHHRVVLTVVFTRGEFLTSEIHRQTKRTERMDLLELFLGFVYVSFMGFGRDARVIANLIICSSLATACEQSERGVENAIDGSNAMPNEARGANDATAAEVGSDDEAVNDGGTGDEPGATADGSPEPDTADKDTADKDTTGAGPGLPREQIGQHVFDEEQLQTYYLTLSDDAYATLMDFSTLLVDEFTVNRERYVEAALQVGDEELPAIGVRLKGNYSIWGCVDRATGQRVERVEPLFGDIDVCQRFSLKLDFDRYDDSGRLDGLKKLNLHAMAADPSKLRERLAYSLFRDMDILAPRAVHARVYINGEYHGLFAAVEQVDGRFTANRFPTDGDGNLYKQLWPDPDISVADAEDALKTNDEPGMADVSAFLAFKAAVGSATEDDFATAMEPFLDLDYLARYIVVDRAIANYDGIMAFYYGAGWGPNNQNYYWYDAGSGRFQLIPWDFDKAFWYPEPNFWSENAANGKNIVPNWNVVTSSCDGYESGFDSQIVNDGVTYDIPYRLRQIDCDPFLRLLRNEIYERQAAIAAEFIDGPFSTTNVSAKVEAWRMQLAAAIEEDPGVDSAHWESYADQLLADIPRFQANLRLMMDGLITE